MGELVDHIEHAGDNCSVGFDLMTCSVASGAVPRFSLRRVGQRYFDALLRILTEVKGLNALGKIKKMRLNRRKVELGSRARNRRAAGQTPGEPIVPLMVSDLL